MPVKKVEPLVEAAVDRLPSIADPQSGLIPPIHSLARHWSVSIATANRVLKCLADKGFLEKNHRRNRYFIAGLPGESTADRTPIYADRADHLMHRIRNDMVNEAALGKALPSIRRLMAKYRCSYYTCKEAMSRLKDQGWMSSEGYPRLVSPHGRSTAVTALYVICHRRVVHEPAGHKFLGELERIIATSPNGIYRNLFIDHIRKSGLPKSHTVAGYICFEPRKFRLPGNIHSEVPVVYVGDGFEKTMNCTCIGKDHQTAGKEVAEHLNILGHRHIAVLSHMPSNSTPWVRDRISGISRIYPNQGPVSSSTVFSAPPESQHAVPKITRNSWTGEFLSCDLLKDLQKSIPSKIVRSLCVDPVYRVREMADLSERMEPVFSRALNERRITAWLCINDELALCAQQFLRKQGIAVPDEISVMGFDNSTAGRVMEISTYDFRPESMAHAAVLSLHRPAERGREKKSMLVKGGVIARNTTGKAPENNKR